MRNHSLLLWALLFMDGVFGTAEVTVSVSVMNGDSVTLHTNLTELQSDDIIDWMSEDGVIIAKIENKKISEKYVPERRFKGRLELDSQNGSLTIRNITAEHKGLYRLDIRGGQQQSKRFNVTVRDDVESVSVMEGDSVTLHTGVTKVQGDHQIQWKFGDQVIPIDRLNDSVHARWSNIDLNGQTGDLTIRNIQDDQYGCYKVEISTNSMILHRKVRVNISDEIKTVSVKKGDYIILRTGVIEMRGYDQILWKFEDHLMAEIIKGANQFSLYDSADGRFGGRLHPDHQTGSLTISDSETTDSGDYHLYMSNSMYTLQRTISVTVSGLSSVIVVICVCVALVAVVVLVVFYYQRKLRLERQRRDRTI